MMTKIIKKTKQIAIGWLVVLSLCASSVAACVCSHHAEKIETESVSCHESVEVQTKTGAVERFVRLDRNDDCGCVQPAPRAFSKSETLKIEKQAAIAPFAKPKIEPVSTVLPAENHYFEKPFYLSDSFYNLKSPRAPPARVK